ncbi:MAG: L-lactate dehydrogenase [Verrucomicrobia bacterium]|nr:L-lactate dehydrogenase [Verrucomicrobiota bacterium]
MDYSQRLQTSFRSSKPDSGARKPRKAVMIGAGMVGMAGCYSMIIEHSIEELVIIDLLKEKVEAEVLDLQHGLPLISNMTIRGGDYSDCAGAEIIIVTAGAKQAPGQPRLELAQINVNILKKMIPEIMKYAPDAIILMVTNPVDVLTYVTLKISGKSRETVIGSGTVLDSARFQRLLGNKLGMDGASLQAYILGEHGDSSFAYWSGVTVGGTRVFPKGIEGLAEAERTELTQVYDDARRAAYDIIAKKGYTSWAIGLSTNEIVKAILHDKNRVLPVSTCVENFLGVDDVCLSLPMVVNHLGAVSRVNVEMTPAEVEKLRHSCTTIKQTIKTVGF